MSQGRGGLQGERTRKHIRRALVELVEEKGFAAVTVGDIAERALINRATVYRYYRDKHALVEEIFHEVISELPTGLDPSGHVPAQERVAGWEQVFEHVGAHHRVYAALLGRRGDPGFVARLRDRCVELARYRLRAVHNAGTSTGGAPGTADYVASVELELALAANLVVGAISWWLEHQRPCSAHRMAEAITRIAIHGYFGAVGINATG